MLLPERESTRSPGPRPALRAPPIQVRAARAPRHVHRALAAALETIAAHPAIWLPDRPLERRVIFLDDPACPAQIEVDPPAGRRVLATGRASAQRSRLRGWLRRRRHHRQVERRYVLRSHAVRHGAARAAGRSASRPRQTACPGGGAQGDSTSVVFLAEKPNWE